MFVSQPPQVGATMGITKANTTYKMYNFFQLHTTFKAISTDGKNK